MQLNYDAIDFCRDGQRPAVVLAKIPLVTQSFDAPALASDRELWGRAVVELEVTTNVPNVQLTASLWALPPSGPERFLTLGTAALRSVAAGRHRLHIELEEIPYVIQAGHRLRLKLQNVAMRFLPTSVHYLNCPEFQDADWTVHADPAFAAWLDLPLRVPEPAFVPRFARASAAAGIDHRMFVRAGAARAGQSYVVCLGTSGVAPGLGLGAQQVWLNPDSWTSFGLGLLNTPVFQGFSGTLDANGEASARFFVPGLPSACSSPAHGSSS